MSGQEVVSRRSEQGQSNVSRRGFGLAVLAGMFAGAAGKGAYDRYSDSETQRQSEMHGTIVKRAQRLCEELTFEDVFAMSVKEASIEEVTEEGRTRQTLVLWATIGRGDMPDEPLLWQRNTTEMVGIDWTDLGLNATEVMADGQSGHSDQNTAPSIFFDPDPTVKDGAAIPAELYNPVGTYATKFVMPLDEITADGEKLVEVVPTLIRVTAQDGQRVYGDEHSPGGPFDHRYPVTHERSITGRPIGQLRVTADGGRLVGIELVPTEA